MVFLISIPSFYVTSFSTFPVWFKHEKFIDNRLSSFKQTSIFDKVDIDVLMFWNSKFVVYIWGIRYPLKPTKLNIFQSWNSAKQTNFHKGLCSSALFSVILNSWDMSGDLRQFLQQHRAEILKEAQRLDKLKKILNDEENKENSLLNGDNDEHSTRPVNKVKASFGWLSFKSSGPFVISAFSVEIICSRSVFVGPFVTYVDCSTWWLTSLQKAFYGL